MNDKNLSRSSSDILVVDDVLENLKLLVNLLTPAGYKVRPASNGAEALDAVKRKKPDLILLDIKMPSMDGFEVCKRLKADSQSKKIPIIFISGLSETDDKVKAFQAGGVDYITKPFQEEEVLMRVQTHIELQRMRIDLERIVTEQTVDLRMSEERFRMTFNQAAVGIAHVDTNGKFLRLNQKFCDIAGYTKEEMTARSFQEITYPEDLSTELEYYEQILARGIETYSMEKRYIQKNKTIVWVNLTVSLVSKDNGGIDYFIAVVEDISDRKEVEEELNKSEKNLKLIYNTTGDVLFQLQVEPNDHFRFLSVNLAFLTATGLTEEQIIGKTTKEIIPESSHTLALEKYKEAIRDKRTVDWEETTEYATGVKVGDVAVTPAFDEDGNCTHLIGSVHDITERKLADNALKKEAEFQQLVAKISTLFINIPVDEIDQTINNQFKEIGKFFKADRVTIGLLSEKGEVLSATNMWFSDKLNAEKLATDMTGATYPNLVNYIKDQEYWSFSDPDDFSHWRPERETIEKTDFKSGLVINTGFEKSILEIFVIDVMHSNRVWTKNIIEQVKLLGNVFSNALNRKSAEQALEKEAEFKQLVSRISSKFTGLSGVEFENAIENSLVEIGSYFGVDAVRLFQLSPKGEVLRFRLMWQSEHLAPQGEMTEIHKMKYPKLAEHYSKGKTIKFSKFVDSPQWPEMRNILKFFGTKAGVGVPLEADKSGVDVFAVDSVISEYQWPEDIIEQTKAVGKVLLSAILRREAEAEIQNGYSEIKQLKDQLEQENIYLKEEIKGIKNFDTIIGQSKALKYVLFRVEQVAPTDTTVLISGETGTGKEIFTNALHQLSLRKNKSLVKVNCAALSPTLIESELFGHEKGAFTGANEKRIGRFELADGGTVFLDEIGELSLEVQAKLLRVLQEGEFERLGSSKTIKVNVRIIAATNRNLEDEVKNNRFRIDLYYRLTTFIITIPPLRDRKEDIPLLVKFLVNKLGKKLNKSLKKVPHTVMRKLVNYSWPGNVRELENVIENALIISNGEVLRAEVPGNLGLATKGESKLENLEREHIIKVLDSVNWQIGGKEGAAERLGLKRTTLNSKMKKLNIKKTLR